MGEPALNDPFQLHVVREAPRGLTPPRQRMMTKDISDYIRTAPDRYLACREGRHRYPRVPLSEMRFKQDGKGFDIYVVDCEDCGAAYREEKWLIVTNSDGIVLKMEFVGAVTKYHRLSDDEPDYLLPPGNGYLSGRDLRETRVADHFVGHKVRRVGSRGRGGT